MIEFGEENKECKNFSPDVISCKEIIGEDEANNTWEIVVSLSSGEVYKIIFEQYMMHLTRNESYTFWDKYEVYSGDYFVIFKKSRLLDILDKMIIHTDDCSYPGIGIHYGIFACDHIIDVITANEPKIIKWHN